MCELILQASRGLPHIRVFKILVLLYNVQQKQTEDTQHRAVHMKRESRTQKITRAHGNVHAHKIKPLSANQLQTSGNFREQCVTHSLEIQRALRR